MQDQTETETVNGLPIYISLTFGLTVLTAIVWFTVAAGSRTFLLLAIGWAVVQSILGIAGFYHDTASMPPRIMLAGIFPALVVITITFLTKKGRTFIDGINLKTLTYFHTIRIPVEMVLLLLFQQGVMSRYITFEGTNFDIFSGVTASFAAYFAFRSPEVNKKLLLGWNIVCLLLLLNVVITAIFAIPSPFQKLSLEQPNLAVLYFPFNLLPALLVPMVFFGHLAAIRQLVK